VEGLRVVENRFVRFFDGVTSQMISRKRSGFDLVLNVIDENFFTHYRATIDTVREFSVVEVTDNIVIPGRSTGSRHYKVRTFERQFQVISVDRIGLQTAAGLRKTPNAKVVDAECLFEIRCEGVR
jgi:hypothetical protein